MSGDDDTTKSDDSGKWKYPVPKVRESGASVLTRNELTRRIAARTNLTQREANAALNATLGSIRESLQNGKEVRLVGFGSFKVRTSAARKGVNPRDRKPLEVSAKNRVRFSPGKELSDAVIKK